MKQTRGTTSTKDKQMIVEKYDRLDTEPRRFLRLHKFHRKNERQALIDLLLEHWSFLFQDRSPSLS
ncbi:hypothetical protein PEB0149_012320 [Bartonella apis]|uniref:Uncharacterized protein n=1 Tax=Bartonella apis TaxID=1686310 RepID=A0A1R0F9Z2_9HYPH|nr:hypothetical protein PEB0149_012320 [Bartonella apis]